MSSNFLLICTDAYDLRGGGVPAIEVATMRLRARTWPLYKHTAYAKHMNLGDRCVIYIAGKRRHSQSFLGHGTVEQLFDAPRHWVEGDTSVLSDPAARLIKFSAVTIWAIPTPIRPLVDKLDFIKNKAHWGVHMVGGNKKISNRDYDSICSSAIELNADIDRGGTP